MTPIPINHSSRKYFVDVFENWVANVRAQYDPVIDGVGGERPYSYFGSVQEIVNQFIEKSSDSTLSRKKFPCICLVDDFVEEINHRNTFYEVSPTFYIFQESLETNNAKDRYTSVIKPILYPIFEKFIYWVEFGEGTSPCNDSLIFKKELFRGQIGSNVLIADTVDCLKITFKNLRIKKNC